MTIENNFQNLIKIFKNRILNEAFDDKDFENIIESFKIEDDSYYCKAIAITLSKLEENKNVLKLSALHPHLFVESEKNLIYGNKDTILEYLNKDDIYKTLQDELEKLCQSLLKYD